MSSVFVTQPVQQQSQPVYVSRSPSVQYVNQVQYSPAATQQVYYQSAPVQVVQQQPVQYVQVPQQPQLNQVVVLEDKSGKKKKKKGAQQYVIPTPSVQTLPYSHPAPKPCGQSPNIYGVGVDPLRRLLETNLSDVVIISDSPNVQKHAILALAPMFEVMNTLRYQAGMQPLGMDTRLIQNKQAAIHMDNLNHIVVFALSAGNLQTINAPTASMDWKHIYNQVLTGRNEIAVLILGELSGVPSVPHAGLYDPALNGTIQFLTCPVLQRKARDGALFHCPSSMSEVQQRQFIRIVSELEKRVGVQRKQKTFFS